MNRYIESETLELKEKYTDNIVKEIVLIFKWKWWNDSYWNKR